MLLKNNQKLIGLLYLITTLICFLFFLHTDVIYTIVNSLAFLTSHSKDFYDFNKQSFGFAPYLPVIYILIAIWNAPLQLFNLIDPYTIIDWANNFPLKTITKFNYMTIVAWYKLLIILFNVLTAKYIAKINYLISKNKRKINYLYLTSPFVLYSSLVFSSYDIFSVLFCTIAFYYYCKKEILRFSIFFSIAIACKYFALLIFIPLLLLREKNIMNIIIYFLLAFSISIISILAYVDNVNFIESITYVTKIKAFTGSVNFIKLISLFSYLALCIYIYFTKITDTKSIIKLSILSSQFTYFLFFLAFKWHPQWIIIIIPFMILSYNYINNFTKIILIDFVGFFSFILLSINIWKDNLDQRMMMYGPFSSWLSEIQFRMSDILHSQNIKSFLIFIFYVYLLHPLILIFYEKRISAYPRKKNILSGFENIRFIYIYIFLIPCFLCLTKLHKNTENLTIQYNKSIKCIYTHC